MDDVVAPSYDDSVDYIRLSEAVFEDRAEVIHLARNEMVYATGTWYALARMKYDFEFLRTEILEHSLMQGIEMKPVYELPETK